MTPEQHDAMLRNIPSVIDIGSKERAELIRKIENNCGHRLHLPFHLMQTVELRKLAGEEEVDPEIVDAENNHGQPLPAIAEELRGHCVQVGRVGRGAKFEITLNTSMDFIGPEALKDHIQKMWEVVEIKKVS